MRGTPLRGGPRLTMDPADDELLHRRLNGDLDAAEEAAFLARLKDSPELRLALASRAFDETLLSDVVRERPLRVPVRRRFSWAAVAAAALMLAGLAFLLFPRIPRPVEPAQPAHPPVSSEVDQRIAESVARACRFLESRRADLFVPLQDGNRHDVAPRRTYAELAALSLFRAGYSPSHPLVEELVGRALGRPLESTYVAALRAMLLSEIDPVGQRERISQCAQFLVDSQCSNGQWDYGRAVATLSEIRPGVIRRRGEGPANGDNSAAAFALQGLLACKRAGVQVEPEVLVRARRWWLSCQNPDGGWGYAEFGKIDQTGADKLGLTSNSSYGSATASGVGSLAALRRMLGPDRTADGSMERGVAWLASNFQAEVNPKKSAGFSHVHWLAAAGRAGVLLDREVFGLHAWRAEGARFLLDRQRATGEWGLEGDFMKNEKNDVVDTCLAILFLTGKK
jgi:hypothetical protein